MTRRTIFTQTAVEKIKPPAKGRENYRDARTRGLCLCVHASGAKVWQYVARMGGRPTRLALGHWPALTVGQARVEALKLAGRIAAGKDPAAEKRAVKAETTLDELFAAYRDMHLKVHTRSWPEQVRVWTKYISPALGARRLSTIRAADVAALHARLGQACGPYAANRAIELLRAAWNFGVRSQELAAPNPCRAITRFKEQSRDRFLRADELQRFFAALADRATPELWKDFFTVTLLTGARRANVQAMKWADLELERGLWKISEGESKNAEPLLCVLHPAVVDILRRRATGRQSEHVFPSWGKSGHITEPKSAWKDILARAGLADVHIHDLRRTLGSWQAASGASLSIIGRSLGHRSLAATRVYARLDLDPVRASVCAAGDAMLAAGDGEPRLALPASEHTGKERTRR